MDEACPDAGVLLLRPPKHWTTKVPSLPDGLSSLHLSILSAHFHSLFTTYTSPGLDSRSSSHKYLLPPAHQPPRSSSAHRITRPLSGSDFLLPDRHPPFSSLEALYLPYCHLQPSVAFTITSHLPVSLPNPFFLESTVKVTSILSPPDLCRSAASVRSDLPVFSRPIRKTLPYSRNLVPLQEHHTGQRGGVETSKET